MKKTILKSALAAMLVAAPAVAFGAGIVGDCYDCHTMHNSEQNLPVAEVGGVVSATPIENLLRFDCISCHANDPTGGTMVWTMSGGSEVPQVMHGDTSDLAGGNWRYMLDSSSNRKGHNVIDLKTLYGGLEEVYPSPGGTAGPAYSPPGLNGLGAHSSNRHVFTDAVPFDMFTCAGARGCHGTRSQMVSGSTGDFDGNTATANTFEGTRRTGMAAISGAHHNSQDGAKDATNYTRADDATSQLHDGAKVAEGYRFIVGLKGFGNDQAGDRWENASATSHNEYYGVSNGINNTGTSSCHRCHMEGNALGGLNSRASFTSTITVPNNSTSGFCVTCHGGFHSAGGAGTDADFTDNGVSGAFLRHPSDYVIPASGEYAAYTAYDITAPVARPSLASAVDSSVAPGTDLVMCLSCHKAHGSANDYILNFDYAAMTAGGYASIGAAQAAGGCLSCHTTKGVLPENRP